MKKIRRILTLCIAFLMIMQIVLPTLSQAVYTVRLNIQHERPYSDDDGDETVGNDIYTVVREAIQTIFKIGELKEDGKLNFNSAYYCLRAGLGFGSTEEILANGVEYSKLADLSDASTIKKYFKDTLKVDLSNEQLAANYNSICWIIDNMYLPKNENAVEMKTELFKNVQKYAEENGKLSLGDSMLIEDSLLTDDDIEVVQQIAIWYFTNYDENGEDNSLSLADTVDLANLLQINGTQASNNTEENYNKNRAKQINVLYRYFIDNAKTAVRVTPVAEELELDKTLKPTIQEKQIDKNLNVYVVGPFKINEKVKGNMDFTFTSTLKYKETLGEADWSILTIDNELGTAYLSNAEGTAIENRTKDVKDMVAGEEFYVTILKDVLDISEISEFGLDISYSSSYFTTTTAEVLVATAEDQPVLKVDKEKKLNEGADSIVIKPNEPEPEDKTFDLALRKYITKVNNVAVAETRVPEINAEGLDNGSSKTAEYKHRKNAVEVKTGDTVTYNITIYNEGEATGRATKVVDQLPTGLEFVKVVSGNYEIENYNKETNKVTLKEKTNNTNLAGKVTGQNLDSITIEIECKVTAEATEEDQILTNVAWIAEDYNAENNIITDRDSKPTTNPNVNKDNMANYTGKNNKEDLSDSEYYYKGEEDDDDFEKVVIKGQEIEEEKEFDLSLRKYITKVNNVAVAETRVPEINAEGLDNGSSKTAEYKHRKNAVEVNTGDTVTYNITIYNEGEASGRATKVVDQLPTGLEFVKVVSGNYELENYNKETNKLTLKEKTNNTNLAGKVTGQNLDSTTIKIECKVTAEATEEDQILTNVAWIAEDYNAENNTITDRDSKPTTNPNVNKDNMANYTGKNNKEDLSDSGYYYKGQEDDDDFEKVVIKGQEIEEEKEFDLSLRKYISKIERKGSNVEFATRVPSIDTTPLTQGKNTAKYTHAKNALTVKQNDIITYKLRIYNEGELDGYATEITDYIPEGLGLLVGYSGNGNWKIDTTDVQTKPLVGENGIYKTEDSLKTGILKNEDLSEINVVTGKNGTLKIRDYLTLEDKLIKKYGAEAEEGDLFQTSTNNENDGLFYQEIEVTCIVLASNTYDGTIVNIAEISQDKAIDDEGKEVSVDDRDSTPNDVDLEHYELREENSTYQEDDDDYEPVQLKYFDLALRKFITGVNNDKVDTRIPVVKIDNEGNITYEHTKEPVEVVNNDNVTYTIRVFNEGTIAGYAEEIEDDIPEGLIFLPENEVNKEYGWKMYYRDEEGNLVQTDDVEKAEVIRTDYLSEAKGTVNEETGVNSNLLKEFNRDTMETPDYKDVKVVFKVSQKDIPEENEDGIIINKAHITKDSDDDEDSIPDEWNEGEDDQDIEKVKVQKFDLALFKWVTKTLVTVDGKTTTTETGFKPNIGKTEQSGEEYRNNSEAEPVASVTVDKKKLNSTVVKFVYNIKVVNEGDIEGCATEITDYIPAGLKFVAEDNPLWTLTEDGKITTRALETKILKPGESAEVPVTFTWINGEDNLGLKTNIAAITEDYNEKGVPDEDSTPGNEDIPNYDKEQEDDDDYALVILTLKTGKTVSYIWLGIVIVTILASGTVTIKKYVL